MRAFRYCITVTMILAIACASPPSPVKQIPAFLLKFPGSSFAYPVGEKEYVTEKNDWRDCRYKAQEFGSIRRTIGGTTGITLKTLDRSVGVD